MRRRLLLVCPALIGMCVLAACGLDVVAGPAATGVEPNGSTLGDAAVDQAVDDGGLVPSDEGGGLADAEAGCTDPTLFLDGVDDFASVPDDPELDS